MPPSFCLTEPCDEPSAGRKRVLEADDLIGPGERNLTHEFVVFVRPKFFPLQPTEHHGEPFGGARRRAAPSPSGVGGGGLLHEVREGWRFADMGFERCQIV